MLQPQSLRRRSEGWTVCDMRRVRWGLYSRKVVNGGRLIGDTVLSYVRPAFVNSYPGVCGRRREGQTRVRAGGRATAPPSSPRCLSATTPPPRAAAAATHGDPCQEPEHGRTDGRRTRRRSQASLIAGVGLHTKTTLLRGYLQQIYCSYCYLR